MSTITIVGATGNVGSKTVNNLLGKGHTLRLVARHSEKLQQFADKEGVEIHAGDSLDSDFLAEAIKGSDVVMLMMPGNYTAPDIGTYQDNLGSAQIEAIKKSGVKNVLFLSSVGGHTEDHTGTVAGLARQEKRLNALEGVNVLILRPSYFMENLLGNIGLIKSMGFNGSPLKPNQKFPMIATQDIAKVASEKLNVLNWTGKSVLPLLGPKDYDMAEVNKVLANAIDKPELPYMQFPYDQAKQGMIQEWGLSDSMAQSYIEMIDGINTGVFNLEKRNPESTTPTTIEEFSKTFAYVYNLN